MYAAGHLTEWYHLNSDDDKPNEDFAMAMRRMFSPDLNRCLIGLSEEMDTFRRVNDLTSIQFGALLIDTLAYMAVENQTTLPGSLDEALAAKRRQMLKAIGCDV